MKTLQDKLVLANSKGEDYLTAKELAVLLNVTLNKIYNLLRHKQNLREIRYISHAGKYKFYNSTDFVRLCKRKGLLQRWEGNNERA